jgi:hydroxymethylpyrimidine/phosphomethylpyrimidine kinase
MCDAAELPLSTPHRFHGPNPDAGVPGAACLVCSPSARDHEGGAVSNALPTVLTVAGSDSGAGAGIQADLKTISANGGYGLSVITSVTAQNTRAVTDALALPAALIEAQFAALYDDFAIDAMKSGMLADRERVEVVAACLERFGAPRYVLDPVMISKSGFPLLAEDAVDAVRTRLLPLAALVTPNVHEAQLLAEMTISTVADAGEAGRRILDLGPQAVIVKGGHLEERPGTDVLVTAAGEEIIEGEWVESRSTHGTGCTFSAAIATQLALGRELGEAIGAAKRYLTEAIRHGPALGSGAGPTDHFFYLRDGEPSDWLPRVTSEASR